MKKFILIVAVTIGLLSVILGAFGAHLFKEMLSPEKLESFEVGVKYQLYHALLLLILGFYFDFKINLEKRIVLFVALGTILFSVSIYLLSFADFWQVNLKFLGPITPLGGLLMILGWLQLLILIAKRKFN